MKELNALLPLESFETLQDARDFVHRIETYQVTSGKAGAWFGEQTTMFEVPEGGSPRQMLAVVDEVRENKNHPLYSIMKLINNTLDKNSYFGINPSKTLGIGNLMSLEYLVSLNFMTRPQSNEFLSLSISVDKPYIDVTQEEFDKAKAPVVEIAEVPVSYPSMDYIIKTPNQDFEFDIVVNDGSVGNIWDIRLEVCEIEGGQNELSNWYEVTNAFTPVRQGKLATTKYQIPYNSKRTKLYCRFYFTPRNACDFGVSVKGV